MEYFLGFLIAAAVGLTGVGAGSITAPVLLLFFHLSPAASVGTALSFAAVIKFAVFPIYIHRRQVSPKILLLLCAGGLPGVLAGAYLLERLNTRCHEKGIYLLIGLTILIVSLGSLYRSLRNSLAITGNDHSKWLPPIACLIGGEVGFSSAGAGALGALALLSLTALVPAQVVGTDMVFGLVISVVGGGLHFFQGHYHRTILVKLIVGGLAGAVAGALFSSVVRPRPLRLALSIFLAALGAQLCWKAVS